MPRFIPAAATVLELNDLTMVESTPADQFRPKYHDYIYPLPGDYNIPTATPVVFEVAKLRQVTVQTKPIELLYGGGSGPAFSWTPEGKLRYRCSERGYKRVYMEESESDVKSQCNSRALSAHLASCVAQNR